MPRKKPFSSKQKKKQLQKKRLKKKDGDVVVREDESNKDPYDGSTSQSSSDDENNSKVEECSKSNIQEKQSNWKKTDPNRYKLNLNKETQDEIEERKEKAKQKLQYLSENELEISHDFLSSAGSALDIPKRPKWDYSMTKLDVEKQEEKMFRKYVDDLKSKFGREQLSYFEQNLETWRQLWRVLEIADIVVIVTDVRHPALHFPPSLYFYIVEELKKKVILIINKIDVVPPEVVVAWKRYFLHLFPELKVVSFTSFPKDPEMVKPKPGKVLQKRRRRKGGYVAVGQRDLLNACKELCPDKDFSEWHQLVNDLEARKTHGAVDGYGYSSDENEIELPQFCGDLSEERGDHVLTIGIVGHPNVGKSTFLNGLYGKKVVSTSRTPGHTKYFQTIFLAQNVRLCDCPGLVFPALVDKQLQILSGMYPIAQVREPYTSVGFLAARIPLVHLLKLNHPSLEDDSALSEDTLQWSAWDICSAWAIKRGFLTAKVGRPDVYRAANNILRLAVDGRLCLCVYPPDFFKNRGVWEKDPETAIIAKLQKMFTGIKTNTETWSDEENVSLNIHESDSQSSQSEQSDDDSNKVVSGANKFALLAIDDE